MNDPEVMIVLYSTEDLLEELVCLCFRQATILDNVIKQLSTSHVLHDHENVSRCFDNVVQSDNMWVSKELVTTIAHPLEPCMPTNGHKRSKQQYETVQPHQIHTGFFKSKAPRPLKHITLSRKFSSAQVTRTNAVRLLLVQVPGDDFHTAQSLCGSRCCSCSWGGGVLLNPQSLLG